MNKQGKVQGVRQLCRREDVEQLEKFYCGTIGDGSSRLDRWDAGEAVGDSITPATYSHDYRVHMVALIEDAVALSDDARIVSIGCGTGTVEAELARRGLNIQAIDILPLAVEITRRKGIHAEVADATEWQPDTDFDLIYVDGVAGHLYDPLDHCIRGAARMVSWLKPGGIMLLANDEPAGDQYSAQAESVPGFHWLSMNVIADNLERMDLHVVKAERFNYTRPVSGPRSRAIVLGSVGN